MFRFVVYISVYSYIIAHEKILVNPAVTLAILREIVIEYVCTKRVT